MTQIRRMLGVVTAACVILLLAVAALVIAFVSVRESESTANCVNDALGKRTAPMVADEQAHIAFAVSLDALFKPTHTVTEQKAAVLRFKTAVDTYVATLVADQQARDRHPLGKC